MLDCPLGGAKHVVPLGIEPKTLCSLLVSRANCYSMEPKTELSLGGIQTRMYELNCFTCFYTFCNVFQTSCKAKAFSLLAF